MRNPQLGKANCNCDQATPKHPPFHSLETDCWPLKPSPNPLKPDVAFKATVETLSLAPNQIHEDTLSWACEELAIPWASKKQEMTDGSYIHIIPTRQPCSQEVWTRWSLTPICTSPLVWLRGWIHPPPPNSYAETLTISNSEQNLIC